MRALAAAAFGQIRFGIGEQRGRNQRIEDRQDQRNCRCTAHGLILQHGAAMLQQTDAWRHQVSSVFFVSGSVKISTAPIRKNAELRAIAAPMPWRSAMVPTANGANALAALPML